jgi:hypothetical protein
MKKENKPVLDPDYSRAAVKMQLGWLDFLLLQGAPLNELDSYGHPKL